MRSRKDGRRGTAPRRGEGRGAAPWATLDPALGPPLRAVLPALVEEVLDAVRANVPAYAAPLEGTFGRTVRPNAPSSGAA